jgi:hypothetical protein
MVNEKPMTRDELKAALPDYLADELPPKARLRFEASLCDHSDLADEARSLAAAVEAMRALDEETVMTAATSAPPPSHHSSGWNIAGRLLRLAAMLALAFGLGYAVRAPRLPATGTGTPATDQRDARAPDGAALETRYAMEYLADGRRSGLGRALVAFSRAVNEEQDETR